MSKFKERHLELATELQNIINRYSLENGSDTPDFILAAYLLSCLSSFDSAMRKRRKWLTRPVEECSLPSGEEILVEAIDTTTFGFKEGSPAHLRAAKTAKAVLKKLLFEAEGWREIEKKCSDNVRKAEIFQTIRSYKRRIEESGEST